MHDCIQCGGACCCDLDDTYVPCPDDCSHRCPPEPEEMDADAEEVFAKEARDGE
jgi:hypothetical protein